MAGVREELLSPDREPVEMELEVGLRPRRLDEFVGQAELKGHLRVVLAAARERGQAADHFLFAGPPGLGKTTLAHIVAAEMGAELQVTSGPALERAGDLAAILTKLEPGDVLFIDEIHRKPRPRRGPRRGSRRPVRQWTGARRVRSSPAGPSNRTGRVAVP